MSTDGRPLASWPETGFEEIAEPAALRSATILGLIATGLSKPEIAGRLFASENTVTMHSSRLFDKLGAKRRTQAVQIGKTARLIP